MRVAVYLPKDHPAVGVYPEGHPQAGQPAEPTPFAYRLGRIEDGVHNHILHTGETIPIEEFVGGLVKLAREEYEGAVVTVERLVQVEPPSEEHPAGQAQWVPADAFNPDEHTPAPPGGSSKAAEFSAVANQQTGGGQ